MLVPVITSATAYKLSFSFFLSLEVKTKHSLSFYREMVNCPEDCPMTKNLVTALLFLSTDTGDSFKNAK